MAIPKKDLVKRLYDERKAQGLSKVSVWVDKESAHKIKELAEKLNNEREREVPLQSKS